MAIRVIHRLTQYNIINVVQSVFYMYLWHIIILLILAFNILLVATCCPQTHRYTVV